MLVCSFKDINRGAPEMAAKKLLTDARNYLQDILGPEAIGAANNDAWAKLWADAGGLPFYLQSPYTYYRAELFGQVCLLMLAQTPEGETPAVVRKHRQAVSMHFNGEVLYVIEAVSSYNRKRLIEQRVPFLVPGNQLYLPAMGVDLREYFKPGKQAEPRRLGAPAQAIVLREILQRDCTGLPAKDLANRLGYSPMTITRAINELTELQLATSEKVGKEKHLHFSAKGRSLWEAALPALQNPVNKRAWLVLRSVQNWEIGFDGVVAGETALAHYTSLADTGIKQWAMGQDAWSNLAKRADVTILASQSAEDGIHKRSQFGKEPELMEIEVWSYSPKVIAPDKRWVDPLSLWLSLATSKDERVEIAREGLLEQVWSTFNPHTRR